MAFSVSGSGDVHELEDGGWMFVVARFWCLMSLPQRLPPGACAVGRSQQLLCSVYSSPAFGLVGIVSVTSSAAVAGVAGDLHRLTFFIDQVSVNTTLAIMSL